MMLPHASVDVETAWLAGLLEGEGSFVFNPKTVRIACCQSDREVLDYLVTRYGGTVSRIKKAGPTSIGNRQDLFQWNVFGRLALPLMLAIYPLMSRRRQSQIANAIELRADLEWSHSSCERLVLA